jgi:hypothetical protein
VRRRRSAEELSLAPRAVREHADVAALQVGTLLLREPREAEIERRGVGVARLPSQPEPRLHQFGVRAIGQGCNRGRVEPRLLALDETPVRLLRHLRKRRVVEQRRHAVEHGVRAAAIVGERAGERIEVAVDGELPVDERLATIERPPEVPHVVGVHAGRRIERQEPRLGADDERRRARALRELGARAEVVAGDVGGDDERLAAARRAGAHPVDGHHDARRPAVARVLQLERAAARREAEQLVQEDARRLRVVDGRLGADDEEPDLVGRDAAGAQRARRRVRAERHRVFPRRGHRHRERAEPDGYLLGRDAARGGETVERQRVPRDEDAQLIDTDLLRRHRDPSSRAR